MGAGQFFPLVVFCPGPLLALLTPFSDGHSLRHLSRTLLREPPLLSCPPLISIGGGFFFLTVRPGTPLLLQTSPLFFLPLSVPMMTLAPPPPVVPPHLPLVPQGFFTPFQFLGGYFQFPFFFAVFFSFGDIFELSSPIPVFL